MGSPGKPRRNTTAAQRKADRDARLAEALRANLRRRKAQAHALRDASLRDAPQGGALRDAPQGDTPRDKGEGGQ